MKCVELRVACTERNQLASGNKAHLQHRLLRLCGHVAWATPPPPGGTRAERAAGSFHAPGHADYGTNEFITTTGVTGGHINYDDFKRMILWVATFCEQGVTCMEYGQKQAHKHAHSVVKCRFPTGKKGSIELLAMKMHVRTFLRYTEKAKYVNVTPIDKGEQDFERSAGYCFKDRRMPGFAWKSHNMTQDHIDLCIATYERHQHGYGVGKTMLTKANYAKKLYLLCVVGPFFLPCAFCVRYTFRSRAIFFSPPSCPSARPPFVLTPTLILPA